jgi:SAM-dependent methyltransferase
MCPGAASDPDRTLQGWPFRRCGQCGLVFMSPRPSAAALRRLYDERYFHSQDPSCGYADYAADRAPLREKAERLLPAIERHGRVGRLLDVGCAYGFTLEVARERGWECAGVEPAPTVRAGTAARLGLRVEPDLMAARFPDAAFDAVTLWDVIEHLPDPRAALREVARVLRPGGICSVVTPDAGSLAARLLGARWEERQKMPEHIFFFDRPSLSRLLRGCGFEPLAWTTVGKRMSLDETLTRLLPAAPRLLGAVRAAARGLRAARLAAYFDPRWKMAATARLARRPPGE